MFINVYLLPNLLNYKT